jgi:rhodanese-related sulfurtransferase
MVFKQYYLGCLSHASFLIGDEKSGRAVVVDPQRHISRYVADAAEHGLTIERVIETHFHADFLSGHLELKEATGAIISYGSVAESLAEFPIDGLTHGLQIVDVRGPGEVAGGKITGAREVPLPRILDRLVELEPTAPTVVYCAGGYRSMIAASVMRASGFRDVSDLIGGYGAWEQAGLPMAGRVGAAQ